MAAWSQRQFDRLEGQPKMGKSGFVYRGITVTGSNLSKRGTGRVCLTVQSWSFCGPKGMVVCTSQAAARKQIDRLFPSKDESAARELRDAGAVCERRVDRFGMTAIGWWIDDVFLGVDARSALESLRG